MPKPNCYECKFRGKVVGSAHSSCHHPEVKPLHNSPLFNVAALFGGVGLEDGPLEIKGDEHGKRMGWFAWPANFDPVWLLNCTGFEAKQPAGCVESK